MRRKQAGQWTGRKGRWWGVLGFLCLVGMLLGGVPEEAGTREAEGAVEEVPMDAHLDVGTPRTPTGLKLPRGEWKYNCMDCHRSLKAKWHLNYPLMEHGQIELRHGNNRFCLNCHHPENRNAFVDYDGAEIPERDVVLLCAKCHGPQHRDWMAGAHGRRNGYWNRELGESAKLDCIQCHDPHDPGFKPMAPLPGPTYPARAAGSLKDRPEHKEEGEQHG